MKFKFSLSSRLINKFWYTITAILAFVSVANAQFVHPGITHTLSDLDRMKYMVEAGIEPWATTFDNLSKHGRAQHTYTVAVVNQDPSYVIDYSSASRNWFINDGTAAYYNALMWYITGDSRHADKAIEIFNTYKGLRRTSAGLALDAGRVWRIIEAAEIIKHTYNGWSTSDRQDFEDMLVYPGYSTTNIPTAAINSGDVTFYWRAYQGDPVRHGNQGLFAMRTMMAMGIFLDNEVMYDRALRYLRGQSHRADDLAYPSGPPVNNNEITECEFFDEFTQNGLQNTIQDYGFNEVMSNYIFENGQSQESSRDQAHALGGVSTIAIMGEMAWKQGDDLYGHLDNRTLLGLEFFYRYNISPERSYPDQTNPWNPTVASGEYIERTDRSGRWRSKVINPGVNCDQGNVTIGGQNLQPAYEMNLGHYRDRLLLPSDNYKWLQRGFDLLTDEIGVEGEGTATDHPGYGGLKFRRVSPGDPISGINNNGLPNYAMNVLPMTIEAENFDYFVISGEDRTYNDVNGGNILGAYRTDENVDIETSSEGGFNVGSIKAGEYLTYTVYVPQTGSYDISARIASPRSTGEIGFEFAGIDKTGDVAVPNTGGWQTWQTLNVANNVNLTQGVQQMKVYFSGSDFNLNNISISNASGNSTLVNITKRNAQSFALDGNHGGANGQNLYLWSANQNNVNQQWIEIDRGNGYYSYQKYGTDFCIDGNNGGENGQNVYLWTCSNTNQNQQWRKVSTGSGTYRLEKRNAPEFALDGNNGGDDGQNVYLWTTGDNNQNQQWVFSAVKNADLIVEKDEVVVGLYPVPFKDILNVTVSEDIQYGKVEIIDSSGSIKFSQKFSSTSATLDLGSLANGFYIIKITGKDMIYRKSIIKR